MKKLMKGGRTHYNLKHAPKFSSYHRDRRNFKEKKERRCGRLPQLRVGQPHSE